MSSAKGNLFPLFEILNTIRQWTVDGDREVFSKDMAVILNDIDMPHYHQVYNSWVWYAHGLIELIGSAQDPEAAHIRMVRAAQLGNLAAQLDVVASEVVMKTDRVDPEAMIGYMNNIMCSEHASKAYIHGIDKLHRSAQWEGKISDALINDCDHKRKYQDGNMICLGDQFQVTLESVSSAEINKLKLALIRAQETMNAMNVYIEGPQSHDDVEVAAENKEQAPAEVATDAVLAEVVEVKEGEKVYSSYNESVGFGAGRWITIDVSPTGIELTFVRFDMQVGIATFAKGDPKLVSLIASLDESGTKIRKPYLAALIDNIIDNKTEIKEATFIDHIVAMFRKK